MCSAYMASALRNHSRIGSGAKKHTFVDEVSAVFQFSERPSEVEGFSDYYIDGAFVGSGSSGMSYEEVQSLSDSLDDAEVA